MSWDKMKVPIVDLVYVEWISSIREFNCLLLMFAKNWSSADR